ncbi:unnamed protein product [Prunus armeniaca]
MMIKLTWQWVCSINQVKAIMVYKLVVARTWTNVGILESKNLQLLYGWGDQVDEIARMGRSTILESLVRFCDAIKTLYTRDYLCKPTPRDLQRLLQKVGAQLSHARLEASTVCTCNGRIATAWQGDYGNRNGQKTIILEAIASFDTWVWHAFF